MVNKQLNTHTGKGKQYLLSTLIVLSVSGLCFAFSGVINYRIVAFLLLVTVSLTAVSFDIFPVLLAAVLSAFIWNFFFIPPRFTFHVDASDDTILFTMYFIIALINAVLTYKIRQLEKSARIKEERANSVKLYNTILNSLSHELRTPIATIIGAADNLQMNRNLKPSDKEQLVVEISKASLRLNQQVENLLNISRLESGHIQPKNNWCDIADLLYQIVARVEDNARTKISISIREGMPLCLVDEGMLDQIIYNLLNNAAIHNPEDTAIAISASCHGDMLEVIIEDNGKGFKEKEIKDVFEKFSRTKSPESSGSGLGLSIVKGFTEALGGTVSLGKGRMAGATFRVSIPCKTSLVK